MRTIVIGDVHGCLEELNELLKICEYKSTDRLIFVGDLIDRGPDSLGVVKKIRELNAECVLGNHERKLIKWHDSGCKVAPKDKQHYYKFSNDDVDFIKKMPLFIKVNENLYVIHGGAKPESSIEKQSIDDLCHLRYVDLNFKFISLREIYKKGIEVCGAYFWTHFWKGPESIIYGHNVHDLNNPFISNINNNVKCYGIDTGACFGGHLTALIIENEKIYFEQVKAKKEYVRKGFE